MPELLPGAGCQADLPPRSTLTQAGAGSPESFGQHQHIHVVVNPKQPPKRVPGASPRDLPGRTVHIHLFLMGDVGWCDELDFTPGD